MMNTIITAFDMASEGGTHRLDDVYKVTVEEVVSSVGKSDLRGIYEGVRLKPIIGGHMLDSAEDQQRIKLRKKTLNIATWNVRSLNGGKLEMVIEEMKRYNVDVLGVTEIKWKGQGHFNTENGSVVIFSGSDELKEHGVAVILSKNSSRALMGYNPINNRVMTIRLRSQPINVTMVVIYAPTTAASDEEIDDFYENLQDVIDKISKRDILILMGDLNSKVGKTVSASPECGKFGLGKRNERGERLIEFCQTNKLVICNTCFQQHPRRIYTWESPDHKTRNQIDYIMIQQRWRSSIKMAKTFPGADCGSDHQLLVAGLKLKLRRIANKVIPKRLDVGNIPKEFGVEIKNRFEALMGIEEEKMPEELWEDTKQVLKETASRCLRERKKIRKPWINDDTLTLIQKRRLAKAKGAEGIGEYQKLNKDIKIHIKYDKQDYINKKCKEIEFHSVRNNTKKMYDVIRSLRQKFCPKLNVIKNDKGVVLTEMDDVKKRWKEYCVDLFSDSSNGCNVVNIDQDYDCEPVPLREEIEKAINELKNGRSPGFDEIPAELIKATGGSGVEIFHKIIVKIWETGQWPLDWKRSIFIPLPKKGDLKECSNYRTISLISHASKILLKVILSRIYRKFEEEMPEEQAGFRRGRGTCDQILNIRLIIEKCREFKVPVVMCFIDYSKAFDCVQYDKLWETMINMGFSRHMVRLIKLLYQEQEVIVRTNVGNTESFKIEKGVRQGCILSPYLFNLYAEDIMRQALEDLDIGVRIGGLRINNLRFADDTTLFCHSAKEMEIMLERVCEVSKMKGLLLNAKKTKIMMIGDGMDTCRIRLGDQEMEIVEAVDYLGSRISNTGSCSDDIKRRQAIARTLVADMTKFWKDRDLSIRTKLRIVDSVVFPVATYGCEAWSLKEVDRKKIDAFEMWCYRRILRVSYVERKTNEWILKRIKRPKTLLNSINKRKLKFFGHIERSKSLVLKTILEGTVEGRRGRGRPTTRWRDGIGSLVGMTMCDATRRAKDRSDWRNIVMAITARQGVT